MKQKDIALIVFIAGISGIVSYAASHLLFAPPANRHQQVAVISPINTSFATPDPMFFNSQSIDPAQLIEVGSSNNSNPFSGSGR